jgi:ElaB/YqjD/DUF883 family membrane-anchored ribosome-binding protein
MAHEKINKGRVNMNESALMDELRLLISEAEKLIKITAKDGGEIASQVRSKAESAVSSAKHKLEEVENTLVSKGKEASQRTNEYVHENPWKAVGIAAGIGLIVGLLIGRR